MYSTHYSTVLLDDLFILEMYSFKYILSVLLNALLYKAMLYLLYIYSNLFLHFHP